MGPEGTISGADQPWLVVQVTLSMWSAMTLAFAKHSQARPPGSHRSDVRVLHVFPTHVPFQTRGLRSQLSAAASGSCAPAGARTAPTSVWRRQLLFSRTRNSRRNERHSHLDVRHARLRLLHGHRLWTDGPRRESLYDEDRPKTEKCTVPERPLEYRCTCGPQMRMGSEYSEGFGVESLGGAEYCRRARVDRGAAMAESASRARAMVAKGDKKLSGWSMFGNKYEDAASMFESAANQFKLAKECTSERRGKVTAVRIGRGTHG